MYNPASVLLFCPGFNPKTPTLDKESSKTIVDFAVIGEKYAVKWLFAW